MAQAEHDSITRRAILSGAAAAIPEAVLPIPGLAAPAALSAVAVADPIFAAIDAHARAYDDINTILDAVAAAEGALDVAKRGTRRAARKRYAEVRAEEGRLGRIESDAIDRLVETVPQTLQGAAAALAYVRKRFEQGYPMCEEESYMALLASIEDCLRRALGNTATGFR
jgi:hypothetical protein